MSNFVIVLSEILGPDYTMRVRVEFFPWGEGRVAGIIVKPRKRSNSLEFQEQIRPLD